MHKPAIIVAGMGRCGSSLTMQMLHRAGVPCVGTFPDFETQHSSIAGFRDEFVLKLSEHAIKILDPWRLALPELSNHVVIWLDREPQHQAESIAKLLASTSGHIIGRNERRALAKSLRQDREKNIRAFRNSPIVQVDFRDLIVPFHSHGAQAIATFLQAFGWGVDVNTMCEAIIPRGPECYPGMIEMLPRHDRVEIADEGRSMNPRVTRHLLNPEMDHIDHALGRPLDPMRESGRNYFAVDAGSLEAKQFDASPNWRRNERKYEGGMLCYHVTDCGRAALRQHLLHIGDRNKLYEIEFDDFTSTIVSTSPSKARYDMWLRLSDTGLMRLSFGAFAKAAKVRAAQQVPA